MRAILILGFICCLAHILAGQQAYCVEKAKPMLGVYYFPGWYRSFNDTPADSSEWRNAIMKAALPRPICGFYNDSDPRLWNYYIKWMKTSGIDFIAFDWYHNDGQDYLYESLDRGFLGNESNTDLRFCLHWCNHGGPWWAKPLNQSKEALVDMIDRACSRYFYRPNYVTINGKPLFIIYDPNALLSFGGFKGAKSGLQAMRDCAKKHGYKDLYLVAVYARGNVADIVRLKELGFDAFCAYTYQYWHGPKIRYDSKAYPYSDVVDNVKDNIHPFLSGVGKGKGIPYWPTVFSGWDDRPRAGLDAALVLTDNTPDQFGKMLKSALNNVNPVSPVVMMEAWNEWGEGACIEPSRQYGFGYLRQIAQLTGSKNSDERLPTAEECASWNILSADELKTAKENESKPWPIKGPIYCEFGKCYEAPRVKMPLIINLGADGPKDIGVGNADILARDAAGLLIKTTGSDPMVAVPIPETPINQVGRITLEVESIPGQPAPESFEIYFATGLFPGFVQFASAIFPPPEGGKTSLSINDIMAWDKFGTPIKQVRIDPGNRPGAQCRLKRLIFSDK